MTSPQGPSPTTIVMHSRFNFTYNFLIGAASQTRLAIEIDKKGLQATEHERLQHLGYVSGAIMQAVAALESEVWSLLNHGPGHHLGSNGLDKNGAETLLIVADSFEKQSILDRYDLVLQLLRRKKLDTGKQPTQDTKLVIGLRNEITHFKSIWSPEVDSKKLFLALASKDSNPPSFHPKTGLNFFPLQCLNYNRAKWALETVVLFIDYFYGELGVKSPLDGHDRNLLVI